MKRCGLLLLLPLLLLASCRDETTSPTQPDGKAAFWSRVGDEGTITIRIDNVKIGELTEYFPLGEPSPNCSDVGTLTYALPPGEHLCHAESEAGSSWTFRFVVFSNQCDTHKLLDD